MSMGRTEEQESVPNSVNICVIGKLFDNLDWKFMARKMEEF